MKDLKLYLEEIIATPTDTMGIGNPGVMNDGNLTEPLISKPRKKRKKTSADFIYKNQE